MPFNFNYAVNDVESANDYQHNAVSDGDVTRGEYRVAMPDGRTQIVKYTADWKNGYNAEVSHNSNGYSNTENIHQFNCCRSHTRVKLAIPIHHKAVTMVATNTD